MTSIPELLLEGLLNDKPTKRHNLISKKLFVRRDPLYLQKMEGLVKPFKELPAFLRESPLEGNPLFYQHRFAYEGDLVSTDFNHNKWFSLPEDKDYVPAYWSGMRSCITADLSTGQLYRLKGMAVGDEPLVVDQGPDVPFLVWGGQFLRSAYNERNYSNKFNKVLADNGIEPVMEYVGLYKLPVRAKRKQLATSIIRVLGDTRLDEFFYALEYDTCKSRAVAEKDYSKISQFIVEAASFYKDIGYIVGRLKRLMELNDQSWSDNPQRTNAHIGNRVLYKKEKQKLGVGLVDFDASCDLKDKPKIALRRQQRQELFDIIASVKGEIISPRPFGSMFCQNLHFEELRGSFILGLLSGWDC